MSAMPRWTDRARLHPLECKLFDLLDEIERAGADVLLTQAGCGVHEALHSLVEWFDAGQPGHSETDRPLTLDDEAMVTAGWEARKNGTPFADELAKARGGQ